jgi:hypothetical protein
MQRRIQQKLETGSKLIRAGGINPLDRDSQAPRALTDINKVRPDLEALHHRTFSGIDELYLACRTVYAKAVVYKPVQEDPSVQIEYAVDFGRFRDRSGRLYEAYCDNFDEVRMIHLHRDFEGWINAVALQFFVRPRISDKFKFRLKSWVKNYCQYEEATSGLPGMHLDFQELFSAGIESLAERIRDFADMPPVDLDLRDQSYDLYGKFVPFEKAFTPMDDAQQFLDAASRRYYARFASSPDNIGIVDGLLARLRFMLCYTRFRVRGGAAAK